MGFIPEWAPNIHPLIIHFPIVILLLAVVLDVLSLVLRKKEWFRPAALFLYGTGVVALIAVYFSGRQAADTVQVADSVYPAISEHANWALRGLWFWVVLVALRFASLVKYFDRKPVVVVGFVVAGIIGNWLIFETAEHGAELVYRLGVGVTPVATVKTEPAPEPNPVEESGNLIHRQDGSIEWQIREDALWVLKKMLRWNEGDVHKLIATIRKDEQGTPVLSFNLRDVQTQFLFPEKFENIALEAVVNLKGFQGSVFLIHHFLDTLNYDFLQVEKGKMSLGRLVQGKVKIMDTKPIRLKEWSTLKVVGTKGHFRGYLNGNLIVHGHGKDLPGGETGLLLKGRGEILLKKIIIRPL